MNWVVSRTKSMIDQTFLRFLLVGVCNTVVGTGIMFVAYNVFHFSYWISSALNYILASVLSYFLNKYFTFRKKEKGIGIVLKFAVNITVCYLIAYGVAKPAVAWVLRDAPLSIQENTAMLGGMVLFVGLNYVGQRFFAFQ